MSNVKLDKNQISKIKGTTFHQINGLNTLDLSNNRIEDIINLFSHLDDLVDLNLDNNVIKVLNPNNFSVFNGLPFTSISLTGNLISKIEEGSFDDTEELRYLKLGSNKIGDLTLTSLGALENEDSELRR
ncbi:leucine-rich repeat-containing protein 15-like [Diabrotica virgifera virgifera]|uniref:Leucine-rich repeat-containing protein 15-like n=1 Tax=Diabrotica virgifera virgifera TaxID=50390 RepID=A0A6P7GNF4_DIAVI|nr:leucine-rich repeat-containing protein 15-like [Diabrotica virgifera virgifera]